MNRREFLKGAAVSAGGLFLPTWAIAAESPRMTFGVVSDVHIGGPGKLDELRAVFRHFDAAGVDAVMVPGDIAHSGLIAEFERFAAVWDEVFARDCGHDGRKVEKLFVTGNHCVDGWEGRWKSFTEADQLARRFNWADNPDKVWQRLFREPWAPVWEKEIKGVTFIGAHWTSLLPPFLKPDVEGFIRARAARLHGTRPFFFIRHDPPAGTCLTRSTRGRTTDPAYRALADFPNAVAITGHLHDSVLDELNVWQGAFTSLGAGCLNEASADLSYANVNYFWHKPSRTKLMDRTPYVAQGGCCMTVDVYDDRLVLHRRSVRFAEPLGDVVVPLPAQVGGPFDFAVMERNAPVPAFAAGATLALARHPNGHPAAVRRYAKTPCISVTFPPAQIAKGLVRDYVVRVQRDGKTLDEACVLANGYGLSKARMDVPGLCLLRSETLPCGVPLSVSVTPRNRFGKAGRALLSTLSQS